MEGRSGLDGPQVDKLGENHNEAAIMDVGARDPTRGWAANATADCRFVRAAAKSQAMEGRSGLDGPQVDKLGENHNEAAIMDDRKKMESACKPGPVRLAA